MNIGARNDKKVFILFKVSPPHPPHFADIYLILLLALPLKLEASGYFVEFVFIR